MIKFASFPTTLHIPFDNFYKEFNEEVHFSLRGITKKWYNSVSIEKHTPIYIRAWERKALHCNYFPDEQGNTIVEYTAEMTVFGLILWIIACCLLVGLVYLPFYILGNRLACSLARKAVKKHSQLCLQKVFTNLNNQ
jgi:hypothetical protein